MRDVIKDMKLFILTCLGILALLASNQCRASVPSVPSVPSVEVIRDSKPLPSVLTIEEIKK